MKEGSLEERYLDQFSGVFVAAQASEPKPLSQRTESPLSPGPVPSILTLHPHSDVPYNGCIPFGQPPNPHLQNSKGLLFALTK